MLKIILLLKYILEFRLVRLSWYLCKYKNLNLNLLDDRCSFGNKENIYRIS